MGLTPHSSAVVRAVGHVHRGQMGFLKLTLTLPYVVPSAPHVQLLVPLPMGSGNAHQ